MKFTQHVPGFCSGVEPYEIEGSLDDILADERIARWQHDTNFHRWSVDRTGMENGSCRLMAEQDAGKAWWVVGYLDETPPGLPYWSPSGI
jgi:hypothetical protein